MGKEKDTKEKEEVLDEEVEAEALEKAVDKALSNMTKAKKAVEKELPPIDEEDEEDEEEEEKSVKKAKAKVKKSQEELDEEIEEPDFTSLSKSLEETIREDEDAEEVLDGVAFVKSLVDGLDESMSDFIKAIAYLSDRIEKIEKKNEKSDELSIVTAKLVKAMSEGLRKMGETPLPRKAILSNLEIHTKRETGEDIKTTLTKSEALNKLEELKKANKIDLLDYIKLDGRVQKGLPLPEEIQKLLVEKTD